MPVNPVRADVTARDVQAFRKWSSTTAGGRRVADAICTMRILGAALIGASFAVAFSWLVFVGFVLSAGAINLTVVRLRQAQAARTAALLPALSGTYTLDDSGVRLDTVDGATHTYPWTSLHTVAATAEFMYVMPTAATGWIIPRRCFASGAEADEFLDYARGHVRDARVDH